MPSSASITIAPLRVAVVCMVKERLRQLSTVVWEGAKYVGSVICQMDEFASEFATKFALTEEEQQELVVERGFVPSLRTSNFLLVGRLFTQRPFNGEALMRTMTALWRPKVKVQAGRLGDNLFLFSFPTQEERLRILSGGPWTFNRALLGLAVADDLVHPSQIPFAKQEFWIQIKGLPLVYMTRAMGKHIGEALGDYVVSDHSKKGEFSGNYLRIRVGLDVTKPLRRCMPVRLSDRHADIIWADLRYEKLPNLCYLCGTFEHLEQECHLYTGRAQSDLDKPYGRWFQEDVFAPDYRRSPGRRFGVHSRPWSMRAPEFVGGDEIAATAKSTGPQSDSEHGTTVERDLRHTEGSDFTAGSRQDEDMVDVDLPLGEGAVSVNFPLPDLNLRPDLIPDCEREISQAIIPFKASTLFDFDMPLDSGQSFTLPAVHGIPTEATPGSHRVPLAGFLGSAELGASRPIPTDYGDQSWGLSEVGLFHEDPFGLGPIIQCISSEKGPLGNKACRRGIGKCRRRVHPSVSEVNSNGKRGSHKLESVGVTSVQKRRCMVSDSFAWQQGSAAADEGQSRRGQ